MEKEVRVRLMGGLSVEIEGRVESHFRTRRAASLLGFLACHPVTLHGRADLMERFWHDLAPPARSNGLSIALSALRPLLTGRDGVCTLASDRNHISLLPERCQTDTQCFDALSALGLRTNDLATLRDAISLYRGPLLPDFDDDWAFMERERLCAGFLLLVRRAAECASQQGDLIEAVSLVRAALFVEPMQEDLHFLLLSLLLDKEEMTEARRHLRRWERTLKAQGEALPDKAAEIMARTNAPEPGNRAAAHTAHVAHPRSALAAPVWADAFFGRRDEKSRLLAAFRNAESRLLTVAGPPGVGKTRFVCEVARAAESVFPGGVAFARLSALADTDSNKIGYKTDNKGARAAFEAAEALNARPGAGRTLLIMDSPERLLHQRSEEFIAHLLTLLRRSPRLTVLMANSRPLYIAPEWQLFLGPLSAPYHRGVAAGTSPGSAAFQSERDARPNDDDFLAGDALQWDAVRLFVDRAVRTWSDFRLTPANVHATLCLAERTEGLPLAIELAATHVARLSIGELAARFAERSPSLISEAADDVFLPPPLQRAIAASVGLLPTSLRKFLFAVASLGEEFTAAAAAPFLEATLIDAETFPETNVADFLTRLRMVSLASVREADDGSLRHRLPASVRRYALGAVSPLLEDLKNKFEKVETISEKGDI